MGATFGAAVALSSDGNTALDRRARRIANAVGGAAWVFTRLGIDVEPTGGKLVPTNGVREPNAQFGSSVALSADGNTALIGASDDEPARLARRTCSRGRAASGAVQQRLTGAGRDRRGFFGSASRWRPTARPA